MFLAASASAGLSGDRQSFVEAEKALKDGNASQFERLRRSLGDYPLAPYLDYQALRKDLARISETDVAAFLKKHKGTPLAWKLRIRWLDQLAAQERWVEYLTFYDHGKNVSRQCHYLHALIATGQERAALGQVDRLWLHGKSQPRACDPVFKVWVEAGGRTDKLTWQRIELAMAAGEWRLAKYLQRSLPGSERVWVDRWVRLHKDPKLALDSDRYKDAHPYREAMLAHAVRRLARWSGEDALEIWQTIKPLYPFSHDQVKETEQYTVRNLVRNPDDDVYAFIRSVEVRPDDIKVHDARIRAAMLREDWPQVRQWIDALPTEERDKDRWRYWMARALQGSGDDLAARLLFSEVAEERSYYGFLAADRVGENYHLSHIETPVSAEQVTEIERLSGVQRARELFALERWIDARREWRWVTRDLNKQQLKAAAKLAMQQGWHDRAIFTLAETGYWDDLELRFPLEHAELVEANARRHGIDIAWVFAVMRQESAFMQNARSHAGAIGLMQLMPATARSVARKMLKRKPPRTRELLEPDTNIALGSAYLKQMQGELGGSSVLATAAYNAGPHRVTRWLPARELAADIWIELVPFNETRGYLRRVLTYTVIYEKRMGREPVRLRDRLHPVPPHVSMIGDMGHPDDALSAS
jgi:soluble lytic murein transglycosylase